MPEKGPPVYLDYDQAALDAAYDQAAYAPNREQLIKRRIRDSELTRLRIGEPERVAYGQAEIRWRGFLARGRSTRVHRLRCKDAEWSRPSGRFPNRRRAPPGRQDRHPNMTGCATAASRSPRRMILSSLASGRGVFIPSRARGTDTLVRREPRISAEIPSSDVQNWVRTPRADRKRHAVCPTRQGKYCPSRARGDKNSPPSETHRD